MATVNEVAKRIVEQAGFEVFDPFAATLHASPELVRTLCLRQLFELAAPRDPRLRNP